MKKTLIILKQFNLKNFNFINSNFNIDDIVVVSNNLQNINFFKEKHIETCFLEEMFSSYSVSDEVKSIINNINVWLDQLSKYKINFFSWLMHCEGGDTSQKVMDSVILNKSINVLLSKYTPQEIYLDVSSYEFYDTLIEDISSINNIKLFYMNKTLKYKLNIKYSNKLRTIMKMLFIILKFFIKKTRHLFIKNNLNSYQVYLQLSSNHTGFLKKRILLYNKFMENSISSVLITTFVGRKNIQILKDKNINYIELESIIDFKDIIKTILTVLKYSYIIKINQESFLKDFPIYKRTLENSLFIFIFNEFLNNLLIDYASKNFVKKTKNEYFFNPQCFVSRVSTIFANNVMLNNKAKNFYIGEWPYIPEPPIKNSLEYLSQASTIFFSQSLIQKNIAKYNGFLEENIYTIGNNLKDNFYDFNISKDRSFNYLGIPQQYLNYICVDLMPIMYGAMTLKENMMYLDLIFDLAKSNINSCFILKPHPAVDKEHMRYIKDKSTNLGNIYIIENKFDALYNILNISDVLISKLSTIILEAMFFNVPTVGIILDNEVKYEYYDDAVTYFRDTIEAKFFINSILRNQNTYINWKYKLKINQNMYLKKYQIDEKIDSYNGIINFIKKDFQDNVI
ncbi:hypothetical protein NG769_10960 [Aliarcobacter cryaerophilus]|uniref:hypothetical protein n=1 Tax=Aliarcobacter cryaerophilus TaxID=28198 RepID=UPI003DA1E15D